MLHTVVVWRKPKGARYVDPSYTRNSSKTEGSGRKRLRKGVRFVEKISVEGKVPLVEIAPKAMVPKPLVEFLDNFLRFVRVTPEEFWQREITSTIWAQLDLSCLWMNRTTAIERYGLKEIDC